MQAKKWCETAIAFVNILTKEFYMKKRYLHFSFLYFFKCALNMLFLFEYEVLNRYNIHLTKDEKIIWRDNKELYCDTSIVDEVSITVLE